MKLPKRSHNDNKKDNLTVAYTIRIRYTNYTATSNLHHERILKSAKANEIGRPIKTRTIEPAVRRRTKKIGARIELKMREQCT